ncbi:carbon-nitrogen hydrolase family protein [Paeniglutamicibacter sp. ORCA_105]|jgi:predicted amidohydrolase|uniref:carbon-nitrogen hydrolase family protein n=1 Tax=Paeniglutamicibacter sp. ORCA_105 TaxID=3377336 RepID=UPI0038963606
MLLAVLQAQAHVLDDAANLATIDNAAQRAASAGADVLLTPELFAVGYAPRRLRDELDPASLPALHDELRLIAARYSIAIVYSLPAVRESIWEITSTFVDEDGVERGSYVKVHLFGDEEKEVFSPGDRPATIIDHHGLKVGMIICFDVEFPESVRAAALQGAELLLVPTALGRGYESVSTTVVPTRALESQLYVAYANHAGVEDGFALGGGSVVADPFGRVLAMGSHGEQLLFAQIDPQTSSKARAEIPYLGERRPDLYRHWGL